MDGKRDWMKTATLVLCAVLLGVNLWQGKRLSELERDVRNAQNSIKDDVRELHSGLSSQLERADRLIQDWDYTTAVDMEKRCLQVDISVTLKKWREDTVVEVVRTSIDGSGGEDSVTLFNGGKGTFTGVLELPLTTGAAEIILEANIQNGDANRRERLGGLGNAAGLLPVQCTGWGSSGPVYEKDTDQMGRVILPDCEANLYSRYQEVPATTENAFRLARNGETVAEQAAELDGGGSWATYICGELSAECQTGDALTLTFLCRDGDGLGYEFFLDSWTVDEGGLTETGFEDVPPKLTWS